MITNLDLYQCLLQQLNVVYKANLGIGTVQLKDVTCKTISADVEKAIGASPRKDVLFSMEYAETGALSLLSKVSLVVVAQYVYYMLRECSLICIPLRCSKFRVITRDAFDAFVRKLPRDLNVDLLKAFRMWDGNTKFSDYDPKLYSYTESKLKTFPDLIVDIAAAWARGQASIMPIVVVSVTQDIPVSEFLEFSDSLFLHLCLDTVQGRVSPDLALAVKTITSFPDEMFNYAFYVVYRRLFKGNSLYEYICNSLEQSLHLLQNLKPEDCDDEIEVYNLKSILCHDGKFLDNLSAACWRIRGFPKYDEFAEECGGSVWLLPREDFRKVLVRQIGYVYKHTACFAVEASEIPVCEIENKIREVCLDASTYTLGSLNSHILVQIAERADAELMAQLERVLLYEYGKYFIMLSKDTIVLDTLDSANDTCRRIRKSCQLTGAALCNALALVGVRTEAAKEIIPSASIERLKDLADGDPSKALLFAQKLILDYNNFQPLKYIDVLLSNANQVVFRDHIDLLDAPGDYMLEEVGSWKRLSVDEIISRIQLICGVTPMSVAEDIGIYEALCMSVAELKEQQYK